MLLKKKWDKKNYFLIQIKKRAGRGKNTLIYAAQFRRSSAVEQLTVNQLVVGSIPTAGANKFKGLAIIRWALFYF